MACPTHSLPSQISLSLGKRGHWGRTSSLHSAGEPCEGGSNGTQLERSFSSPITNNSFWLIWGSHIQMDLVLDSSQGGKKECKTVRYLKGSADQYQGQCSRGCIIFFAPWEEAGSGHGR